MVAAKKDRYVPRLQKHYRETVKPALIKKFGYTNAMPVPRLDKIVINMGVGEAVNDSKKTKNAAEELALIAGQKPVITKSKKAIATFKLRGGLGIGCKVTLRSEKMYEFLDRLVNIALPRVRDFRGVSPKKLRRLRQLRARPQGTDRVPRNRL